MEPCSKYLIDPSPEPWDEWREKVDAKLKEIREMMKAHERACDKRNVSIFVWASISAFNEMLMASN